MASYDGKAPEKWAPITPIQAGAHEWHAPGYRELAKEWRASRDALRHRPKAEGFLEGWLRERGRAFAIETGQIEGLYTLRRGVTEQLIAEGFAGAVGTHTVEGLDDETIRGLLNDQEAVLDMVFDDVAGGRPLSGHLVRSWHQLLTRHQESVVGIDAHGNRVQVPFTTRGQWKTRPNNPVRPDGVVHEYCPPEHVQAEMDRLFSLYGELDAGEFPPNAKAAWLHHRFVCTHPFQDGNGRVARLLMAWSFLREGLPPPIVAAQGKEEYIAALERADGGDLRSFSDLIGVLALTTLTGAVATARDALAGRLSRPAGNGGRVVGTEYYPPVEEH